MKRPFLMHVAILVFAGACAKGGGTGGAASGDLEERVAKLEEKLGSYAAFLDPIMEQQNQQKQAQAASEPDPNTRFAVSVGASAFDGPAGAAVTIIEAFDFA